ncbi:hypothetical protein Shyd_28070 [Streptomyces hydrogenans]|uniref:Uncharacterized protein n=1 Tax=Streptomyces hydrogenans TaxID=1873719 RepID=A0ABQ3P8T3_9ACTN|nr:hypothetical protein Shyd_28070 [Streptomyces hydrogenans]
MRRAVRCPEPRSRASTALRAPVTDGRALTRTCVEAAGMRGPLSRADETRWGSELVVAVRGTMLTERCYQGMTRRSNTDETLMPDPRTAERPVRPR